jgi:hypothetical protein
MLSLVVDDDATLAVPFSFFIFLICVVNVDSQLYVFGFKYHCCSSRGDNIFYTTNDVTWVDVE